MIVGNVFAAQIGRMFALAMVFKDSVVERYPGNSLHLPVLATCERHLKSECRGCYRFAKSADIVFVFSQSFFVVHKPKTFAAKCVAGEFA